VSAATPHETALVSVLLDFPAVAALLGRPANGTTRTWLGRHRGFPQPRQASPNRIFWMRSEVEAWITSLPPVVSSRAVQPVKVPRATARNGSALKKTSPDGQAAQGTTKAHALATANTVTPRGVVPGMVTVIHAPTSCPDCGGEVVAAGSPGSYSCSDKDALGCTWACTVEARG
jgi:predicted DNA-binding transcriptional regulator AlpA